MIIIVPILIFYQLIYYYLPQSYNWYLLHTIVNFIALITVYEDIWNIFTLKDSIDKLEPTGGLLRLKEPIVFLECLISGLHIFHIRYAPKYEDYVHHILMSITLHICTTTLRPIFATSLIFFMNGLPGGIDYFLLIQVKRNVISSIVEKRINTYLNNYVRAPGILILIGFIMPVLEINIYTCFCLLTCFFNAVYYNREVCVNYGRKSKSMSRQQL